MGFSPAPGWLQGTGGPWVRGAATTLVKGVRAVVLGCRACSARSPVRSFSCLTWFPANSPPYSSSAFGGAEVAVGPYTPMTEIPGGDRASLLYEGDPSVVDLLSEHRGEPRGGGWGRTPDAPTCAPFRAGGPQGAGRGD